MRANPELATLAAQINKGTGVPLNREQRRAKKPQQPRVMRWPPIVNAMAVATDRASKIDPADIERMIKTITLSADALREGVATRLQWSIVAGAIDVAGAIERQGVVRGLEAQISRADTLVNIIHARATQAGPWVPPVLHYFEIDAVNEFVNLHKFQLGKLSLAEHKSAIASATGKIKGAGNTVTVNKIREASNAAT